MNVKEFFLSWGMLFLGVIMNVVGVYLVKLKINELGAVQFDALMSVITYFIDLIRTPLVLVGAFFVLAAPLPYAIALSRMDLSVAYPFSIALNCLIILPIAVIYLGEGFTWNKAIGTGLIIISIYVLYR